jgi:hypothetical protein
MPFENRSGVFLVRYDSAESLSPAQQKELETALRTASMVEPVGVVFVVSPTVNQVDHSVPDYWLGVTSDPKVRIAAMAIVTPHAAVSVATRGFSTSNILKSNPVTVKPFQDEAQAVGWVRETMAAARRK